MNIYVIKQTILLTQTAWLEVFMFVQCLNDD